MHAKRRARNNNQPERTNLKKKASEQASKLQECLQANINNACKNMKELAIKEDATRKTSQKGNKQPANK